MLISPIYQSSIKAEDYCHRIAINFIHKNQYIASDHISFYLEGYTNKEVKKEKTKYIIPFRDGWFIAYKSA